ncbi:MAG: hypothetical protein GKR90_17680 [Pseudomonadales bacterium]|nr:hypothetical protein [Pseudomonadales bacterium]
MSQIDSHTRLVDWIQMFTGLAVIVGLVLVIWELQQTRELARAQLAADGWNEMMETGRSTLSETFAQVRYKSCVSPEKLTEAEIQEVLSWFYILRNEAARMRGYSNIGTYEITWRDLARNNIRVILGHKAGRAQYEKGKGNWWPWYEKIADEMIAKNQIGSCRDYLTPIIEATRKGSV